MVISVSLPSETLTWCFTVKSFLVYANFSNLDLIWRTWQHRKLELKVVGLQKVVILSDQHSNIYLFNNDIYMYVCDCPQHFKLHICIWGDKSVSDVANIFLGHYPCKNKNFSWWPSVFKVMTWSEKTQKMNILESYWDKIKFCFIYEC